MKVVPSDKNCNYTFWKFSMRNAAFNPILEGLNSLLFYTWIYFVKFYCPSSKFIYNKFGNPFCFFNWKQGWVSNNCEDPCGCSKNWQICFFCSLSSAVSWHGAQNVSLKHWKTTVTTASFSHFWLGHWWKKSFNSLVHVSDPSAWSHQRWSRNCVNWAVVPGIIKASLTRGTWNEDLDGNLCLMMSLDVFWMVGFPVAWGWGWTCASDQSIFVVVVPVCEKIETTGS